MQDPLVFVTEFDCGIFIGLSEVHLDKGSNLVVLNINGEYSILIRLS